MSAYAIKNRWLASAVVVVLAVGIAAVIARSNAAGRSETGSPSVDAAHIHPEMPLGMHAPRKVLHDGVSPDPTGRMGAGGLAVAHRTGGVPISSERVVASAPKARLFRSGYDAWEPTMGVTEKGVFFNPMGGQAYYAVRSTDNGKSWKKVFDGHAFSADPYMFVDQDTDRIFINDYAPPCHLVSWSDNNGKSWTSGSPAGCYDNADHQTLFAGPPPEGGLESQEYPNRVYLCSMGAGASAGSAVSWCSKSLDGGMTFVPTGAPAYNDDPQHSDGDVGVPGHCNGANAHGFVGRDGTVYLPRGWCGQPWLAMSKDEGTTWTRVQVADNGMSCCGRAVGDEGVDSIVTIPSHETGVVADKKGNLFYTWIAYDRLPYLAVSRDGGETWSDPQMIGPPGLKESNLPGIAIGPRGGVVVRYLGTKNSPWNGEVIAGTYDKTKWNAYLTVIADPLDTDPVLYTASVNKATEPLWVGECGPDPIRCGWGDFQDVVVSNDGDIWAVDVDLCADKKNKCNRSEAIISRLVGGPKL